MEELEKYVLLAVGDFQYGTIVTPSPVNPSSTVGGPASQVSQFGFGNFGAPTAPTLSASGTGTDIVVGGLTVTDLALGVAYTDTYGPTTTTVQIRIKDVASGASGTVSFTGSLVGVVRGNGTTVSSSFVNPAFTSPSPSVTLGGVQYTVTVDPTKDFSAPGTPPAGGSGLSGQFTFHVTEGPATSPSPPAPTPPPTTPNLAPINFQYGTLVTPSPINPSATVGGPASQVSQAGVGNFNTPIGSTFDAAGALGTDITVGTLSVTDLALGATYADTYGPTPVTVQLRIKDMASGLTGTVSFSGSLTGLVTGNGTTQTSSFANPTFSSGSATVVIGTNQYTVTADPNKDFSAPGTPAAGGTGTNGVLSFHITAAPFDAPISATPVNVTAVEGSPSIAVPVATFTDPDPASRASDYAAMIDWGDGTTTAGTITQSAVGAFEVAGTHTYAEESFAPPYTTKVTIVDLDQATNTATVQGQATVNDAPLTAQAVTVQAVEGKAVTAVPVVTFQDSNPNSPMGDFPLSNISIDWGDGTVSNATVLSGVGGNQNFSYIAYGTHTYAEAGTYQTHVVVNDAGGATIDAFGQAKVSDAPVSVTTSPISIAEGAEFSGVLATITDQNPNAPSTDYSATIDWGDGTTTTGSIGISPGGRNIAGSHTWAEAGAYHVTVTLHDVDGASASDTSTATVGDATLTDLQAATLSGVEGQLIDQQTVGSFTDPNLLATAADFRAVVDWGDGSPVQTATLVPAGGTTLGSLWHVVDSHTYSEEGNHSIIVSINEEDTPNVFYQINSHAVIADAPLVSKGVHLTGIEGMPIGGQTTAVVATFTDSDPTSTSADFSAVIAWGDATTSPGVINSIGGPNGVVYTVTYAFKDRHFYAEEGSYPLVVTITDTGGSKSIANGDVLVADAPPTQVTADNITVIEGQHFFLPLATFFEGPVGMPEPISDFTATIQWGDGTPPSLGTLMPGTGGAINVFGGHTYADSGVNGGVGTYHLTVTIHDDGGSIVRAMPLAAVRDVPITLVGLLSPASDTGVSNHDGITKNNQPTFVGLSEKFSDVMLVGMPSAGGSPLFLGLTQADSSGAWSLRSRLIPDGSYTVIAVAIDHSGHTTAMTQVLPAGGQGPLVIDTVAPRINFFGFNRLTGQFFTVFQDDRSGMDQHSILNGANYIASKPHSRLGDILITSLGSLTPLNPRAPQLVTGVLNNGEIIKGGSFFFTIKSGGVEDVAGNALDGEFFGTFPTGDGRPGGDFNARVDAIHNLVFPAQATQSTAAPPSGLTGVPVPVVDAAIQTLGTTNKKH